MFFEAKDNVLINLNHVHKIVPVINGVGCVLHFDNGKTQNISDPYDDIKSKLISKSTADSFLTEETKTFDKKVKS